MPSRLTNVADKNVATTPMDAHNPLNPPIIDGFTPVKDSISSWKLACSIKYEKFFLLN